MKIDLKNFPKWNEINWIEFEISNSIYALKKMFQIQTNGFEYLSLDIEQKISSIKKENSNMQENELNQYIKHLFGLEEEIIQNLKKIQKFSNIVIVFSITESKLKIICDKIERDFKFNIDLSNTKSVLSKHWKFLASFLEERSEIIEKYYTPIRNMIEIRNIINHQDGIATINQYKKICDIKGLKFILFEDKYYLTSIDENFVDILLKNIDEFFIELLNSLKMRTNELL